MKIGEVTDTSAVLWTRLTKNGQAKNRVDEWKADAPNWTVPGMEGMVEFSIWQTDKELKRTLVATLKATAENDFCVQKTVTGLKPATRYSFRVDTWENEKLATDFFSLFSSPKTENFAYLPLLSLHLVSFSKDCFPKAQTLAPCPS